MKITEAIVLAGGLGTRLRSAVPDLPKCMAPVAGKPFLWYVINYYQKQGISRFIFSLGYKHEIIEGYLEKEFPQLEYTVVVEEQPLGTGGAIQLAAKAAYTNDVLVLNGDTLFQIDLLEIAALHEKAKADATLSLKPMKDFDRYGAVSIDGNFRIVAFKEKQYYEEGLINGGVYLINIPRLLEQALPEKFSFEKEYYEAFYKVLNFTGAIQNGYFIDIGIPSDFEKAQIELPNL
ncbi:MULTISPECIES: nucleotidyltransferase family protein [unclassified Paraflavitalea]|uniref:nucleotidyltransferase family protein n=1 Tax=unclassified Paraflavitalea TaxID=2798305 RepID=UPI003D32F4E6